MEICSQKVPKVNISMPTMNDAVAVTEELLVELLAPVAHDFVLLVIFLGVGVCEGGERRPFFCHGSQGEVFFSARRGEPGNVLVSE